MYTKLLLMYPEKISKKMEKIPISYGMNGEWSAILRGAYQKTKKEKIKCRICFQSFTNQGNLAIHMKYKHETIHEQNPSKKTIFTKEESIQNKVEVKNESVEEKVEEESQPQTQRKLGAPKIQNPLHITTNMCL